MDYEQALVVHISYGCKCAMPQMSRVDGQSGRFCNFKKIKQNFISIFHNYTWNFEYLSTICYLSARADLSLKKVYLFPNKFLKYIDIKIKEFVISLSKIIRC